MNCNALNKNYNLMEFFTNILYIGLFGNSLQHFVMKFILNMKNLFNSIVYVHSVCPL